jgi:TRAP-type mannitol/chloroaromatic compound transport system substrate-binding protein
MADLNRRHFLASAGVAAASAVALTGCNKEQTTECASGAQQTFEWKMVTTWPKNFPGLGTGANHLAQLIESMSGGRIKIKVYGANELVGAFEAFDAVSQGTAQMGHGGSYFWSGKVPCSPFFTSVPFGMNAQEMNAWMYQGGGIELWQEAYAPFGVLPFPIGNTGVQMGGWFNKEINSLEDFKGLKMRIPGMAGEVLRRLGGTPVTLPGGDLFPALKSGAIDATEWVGPYNDLAFGFYKAAKFYYAPGWHEPGSVMECIVNKAAFEALPADLQAIVTGAMRIANIDMLADYTANNQRALDALVNKHGVQLRTFPDDLLIALKRVSEEVLKEAAAKDAMTQKVYASFMTFRANVMKWHKISEEAFYSARNL